MLAEIIQAEITTFAVILTVASLAASALIMATMPKTKQLKQEGLRNMAKRGAGIPVIFGRQEIDPLIVWLQPLPSSPGGPGSIGSLGETTGKGFGGKHKGTTVYEEAGMHLLCLGPAAKLHRIVQNGKTIFEGPITATSHPSGTSVDLGEEGVFYMYWGEFDQPPNAVLAAADNCKINSRWPLNCYVFWNKKKLGITPTWPDLKYDLEVLPQATRLATQSFIPKTISDSFPLWGEGWGPGHDPRTPTDRVQIRILSSFIPPNAGPSTPGRWIKLADTLIGWSFPNAPVSKNMARFFKSGVVKLVGTGFDRRNTHQLSNFRNPTLSYIGVPNGAPLFFYIQSITYDFNEVIQDANAPNYYFKGITTIQLGPLCALQIFNLNPAIPTTFQAGAIGALDSEGVNPAHILDQLMFAKHPYGRGLDAEDFDTASLESLASLCIAEEIRASIKVIDHEDYQSVIASIMEDLGVMIPWDVSIGKYIFYPIREPVGDLPIIEAQHILPTLPEIESTDDESLISWPKFTFSDRSQNYEDMPITFRDDGTASMTDGPQAEILQIRLVNDYASAARIARRRAQTVLANPTGIKGVYNRATRLIHPGRPVWVAGLDLPVRFLEVDLSPMSGEIKASGVYDTYGIQRFGDESGIRDLPPENINQAEKIPADMDLAFDVKEAPRNAGVVVPRIRAHEHMLGAIIWFSRAGDTYKAVLDDTTVWGGGVLQYGITADDSSMIITPIGPDASTIESLIGDDGSWIIGRQILIINGELMYLKNPAILVDGSYRLEGLIRGKKETTPINHVAGSIVYVTRSHNIRYIQDPLLVAGEELWVKTQPYTANNYVNLADVEPVMIVLTMSDFLRDGAFRITELTDSVEKHFDGLVVIDDLNTLIEKIREES